MLVVHVSIQVVPERFAEFQAASVVNATASRGEPGVLRFDVLHDQTDPAHVVLVEVYQDADAADAHKQTAHYAAWRDAVVDMMARPRTSQKFSVVDPPDPASWTGAP